MVMIIVELKNTVMSSAVFSIHCRVMRIEMLGFILLRKMCLGLYVVRSDMWICVGLKMVLVTQTETDYVTEGYV